MCSQFTLKSTNDDSVYMSAETGRAGYTLIYLVVVNKLNMTLWTFYQDLFVAFWKSRLISTNLYEDGGLVDYVLVGKSDSECLCVTVSEVT